MSVLFENQAPIAGASNKEGFSPDAPDTQPYGMMDLFSAAGEAASSYVDPGEQWQKQLEEYSQNIVAYERETGGDFYQDIKSFVGDDTQRLNDAQATPYDEAMRLGKSPGDDANVGFSVDLRAKAEIYEAFFQEKLNDPKFQGKLRTKEEILERVKAREKEATNRIEAIRKSRDGGFLDGAIELAGGFVEAAKDPENVAGLFLGGGSSSILKRALKEAGENVAIELSQYPRVREYQEQVLEREYGMDELAKNVAFAGVLGGAFGAGAQKIGNVTKARKELADKETIVNFFDDIAIEAKKSGDDFLATAASLEADRLRAKDFSLADEIPMEREAIDPVKLTLEAEEDLTKITRREFDLTSEDVRNIKADEISDLGKRAEIEEVQELIGSKDFEGEVPPVREVEPITNEFQRAELEGLRTDTETVGTIRERANLERVSEAEQFSTRRIRESLDNLPDAPDPEFEKVVRELGLESKTLKADMESMDRIEKALSVCGGRP